MSKVHKIEPPKIELKTKGFVPLAEDGTPTRNKVYKSKAKAKELATKDIKKRKAKDPKIEAERKRIEKQNRLKSSPAALAAAWGAKLTKS